MKLKYKVFELELKHTFGISRSSHKIQRTLIVSLEQGGFVGYGEAVENSYYHVTIEDMIARLEELREIIENYQLENVEKFWKVLNKYLDKFRFLHCAIDIAANDLYGKILGKPLYEIWGLKTDSLVETNYTIGIDTIDKMKEKLLDFPWPMYKIKLGTKHDIEIIRELRNITNSKFRIDANASWEVQETIENSKALKELGVEFIEQPMNADSWEDMEIVFKGSQLPLIADESCRTEKDVAKCVNRFHGINVKLVKAGGITPARRMLIEAQNLGLKTMVGCMTESSVGIAAVGQLLPYLDYVDMDGALLLRNDIATAHEIVDGKITLSKRPGTGVEMIDKF